MALRSRRRWVRRISMTLKLGNRYGVGQRTECGYRLDTRHGRNHPKAHWAAIGHDAVDGLRVSAAVIQGLRNHRFGTRISSGGPTQAAEHRPRGNDAEQRAAQPSHGTHLARQHLLCHRGKGWQRSTQSCRADGFRPRPGMASRLNVRPLTGVSERSGNDVNWRIAALALTPAGDRSRQPGRRGCSEF